MSETSRVRVLPDAEAVATEGAKEFVRGCAEAEQAGRPFRVALAGGSTPKRMLERLAVEPLRSRIDWGRVHFFFGDERSVPPTEAGSNFRMADEALFSKLSLRADQVHRMRGEVADIDLAAREYEEDLRLHLRGDAGGSALGLDLVYLGMGEDGHTASLFPGTAALDETERFVVSNAVPQLETTRITLTYPMLASARRVVFMVSGVSKAPRLADVLEGDENEVLLPAARVKPDPGELLWLVDEAAAPGLFNRPANDGSRSPD